MAFFSFAFLLATAAKAQGVLPHGWHLKDKQSTGYNGISLDKAYTFLKEKKLKSNQVVVAVIDSGIDTLHEDLKQVLWTNSKEIPGNGIDDDRNGFIDDIHGWNFLGGKDGRNVDKDSYEAARVYYAGKAKFENNTTEWKGTDAEEYKDWVRAKSSVLDVNQDEISFIKKILPRFNSFKKIFHKTCQ